MANPPSFRGPIDSVANIFHLAIDATARRRYSVPIILVLNNAVRTSRRASQSHGLEFARKDALQPAAQPSEPSLWQSNRMYCPQAARAVFRLGVPKSYGGT